MPICTIAVAASHRAFVRASRTGVGVCGIYPYELAETKINIVTRIARENGFPLKATMEKE